MKEPKDTRTFTFFQANPFKSQRAADCVVRAICTALNKSWDDIYDDLCALGKQLKRMPNEEVIYIKYLSHLGFEKQPTLKKKDNSRYTAKEFARVKRKGTYIVKMSRHLSVIKDGKIYDIWDCSEFSVGNYWQIK